MHLKFCECASAVGCCAACDDEPGGALSCFYLRQQRPRPWAVHSLGSWMERAQDRVCNAEKIRRKKQKRAEKPSDVNNFMVWCPEDEGADMPRPR